MSAIAGSTAFLAVAPRIFPPLDRFIYRLTGGRVLVSQMVLPTLVLTTTGHKSGEPRTVPLATLPDGDSYLVVGSNFGRPNHPGWTTNLLRHPQASVTFRGSTSAVMAFLLTDEEKAEVWSRLTAFWPSYDRYVERSHRDLRVFRLTPVAGQPG